jgi:hypothetical protein
MQTSLILTMEPVGEAPIPILRLVDGAIVRTVVTQALADATRAAQAFEDDDVLSIAARSELEVLHNVLALIDGGAAAGAVN